MFDSVDSSRPLHGPQLSSERYRGTDVTPDSWPDDSVQLMLKARRGDRKAFAELYRRFFPIVRHFLASLEPHARSLDGLIQEVFLRAWEHRKRFRASSSYGMYLCGIARNVLREERRRVQKNRVNARDHDCNSLRPVRNDLSALESAMQREEFALVLGKAKRELSARQLQAFELVHIADIPIRQAARIAGCSYGAFRDRLFRARKRLRWLLRHIAC